MRAKGGCMQEIGNRAEAVALLRWYEEMGIDIAVDEMPVDRLAAPVRKPSLEAPPAGSSFQRPRPERAQPPSIAPSPTVPASDATARAAREVAKAANSLEELRQALDSFTGCNLKLTATQLVFADGNPEARVMLVGEAPGRDEDIQGLPFVGRSGRLLDRMLAGIGLDRTSVYIANVVPWRPPGNRTPTPQETATCRPFIERQIELADPDFLVCLGGAAAKEIMGTSEGILRLRGNWRDFDTGSRTIKAIATLHPAYLLRQPLQKRLAWRDLLMLRAALDQAS
jgi:uracil-DNA glycosylase family 4